MKITVNEITGITCEQIKTELLFFIASAKARGFELLRLNIPMVSDEKKEQSRHNSLKRLLATAQRQGIIELYILCEELSGSSTEAEYLKNKYPSITDEMDGSNSYVLKLQH